MRNYDDEAKDVDERAYAYDFDWVVRRYLLRAFAPHLPGAEGRALELGCYRGDMTGQILEHFDRITVLEASGEMCDLVRGRFPGRVEVEHTTFEEAALPAVYDSVFLIHTLEHLDDPVGVLSRIREWLAPEGRLFVAVPNAYALSRQIAVKMGLVESPTAVTEAERKHGHRLTYDSSTLLSHLADAGLTVEEHGGVLVKGMANFQFDRALAAGIIDNAYLDGCYELGKSMPELTASLFAVCRG